MKTLYAWQITLISKYALIFKDHVVRKLNRPFDG